MLFRKEGHSSPALVATVPVARWFVSTVLPPRHPATHRRISPRDAPTGLEPRRVRGTPPRLGAQGVGEWVSRHPAAGRGPAALSLWGRQRSSRRRSPWRDEPSCRRASRRCPPRASRSTCAGTSGAATSAVEGKSGGRRRIASAAGTRPSAWHCAAAVRWTRASTRPRPSLPTDEPPVEHRQQQMPTHPAAFVRRSTALHAS